MRLLSRLSARRTLRHLQVLRPGQLSALAGVWEPPSSSAVAAAAAAAPAADGEARALRLCRYALRRADAVHALLLRMATLPEAIELARATGLTLGQVCRVLARSL